MTIFPLFANASVGAAPQLPKLKDTPKEVRWAFAYLKPLENQLSDDELLRCIAKIFSVAGFLFSDMPRGTLKHFPSTKYDTFHAFSLIKSENEGIYIYVHFNKKSDGYKVEQKTITLSPAIEILRGVKSAWITPTHNHSVAFNAIKAQFTFFNLLNPSPNGVINSLCFPAIQGKSALKPALLQEWGECDLWQYLHKRDDPTVVTLLHQTSHLTKLDCILCIMHSLLIGLEKIHSRQIIHNDVKPSNIVLQLNNSDKGILAKIIDFNSALLAEEGGYLSEPLGTYGYLPPEFYFYAEELGPNKTHPIPDSFSDDFPGYFPSKDVWALGHVFHELYFELSIDPRSEVFEESVARVKQDALAPSLQGIASRGKIEGLIARMMHQNPTHRLTVHAALFEFITIIETL